ncbi:hypothetical protein LMG1860_05920 [Achromobacter denitrificans]|nr:hypothetical protein LMG1231_05744 [Achromobacter denitrificans]CAB3912281.1 hypothetical protein LMG1860_05920 [Achromobacter denitrificans]
MNTKSGIEISESFVIVAYVRCTIRSRVCPMERPGSELCM